jgi:S-adenosylmethionine:diacylglycerol 3-amino-3-carboxypropyl transferase
MAGKLQNIRQNKKWWEKKDKKPKKIGVFERNFEKWGGWR